MQMWSEQQAFLNLCGKNHRHQKCLKSTDLPIEPTDRGNGGGPLKDTLCVMVKRKVQLRQTAS